MKTFSNSWKKSKSPRKQHKYAAQAPLHILRRFRSVHVSKVLREKYGFRNLVVRKQDKVKILTGQFRGKEGLVLRIDTHRNKLYIEGCETTKKDGTKAAYPLHPSNVMLIEIKTDDKRRHPQLL